MNRLYTVLIILIISVFSSRNSYSQVIVSHSELDSCAGSFTTFTTDISTANPSLKIRTFFGDGTSTPAPGISASFGTTYQIVHAYTTSGTYTVKHKLYNSSGTAIDSIQFTYTINCAYGLIKIYSDNNSNCIFDSNEPLVRCSSSNVEIDSSGIKIDTLRVTGMRGRKFTNGITYTFRLLNKPLGATSTCPSSGIIMQTFSNTSTSSVNFGIHCGTSSAFDLGVNIATFYRPVSFSTIILYVTNASCGVQSGIATLNISPKFKVFSYSENPTTINGNTLTWNLTGLSASTSKAIYVYLSPTTNLKIGDTVCSNAYITPTTGDVNTTNNYAGNCDSVIASYDPNNKSVSPTEDITPTTKLTYTINFENTGSDTAFNIHVIDTLSKNLDPKTIEVLSSSHPATLTTSTIPSGNTVARFDFANILLPDKTNANNKGYVIFNIKPYASSKSGTKITNNAAIYFDINEPIKTNTTESKIPLNGAVTEKKKNLCYQAYTPTLPTTS